MLRRLRSLYRGVRHYQIDDEANLKYYGSLTRRNARRQAARQEVNTVLSRMPLH